MGSITGGLLKLAVFGESHGSAVGGVIDGFPSGIPIDRQFIRAEMKRRSAVSNPLATPRKEADVVEILSGVFNDYSEGTPICGIIRNTTTRSGDYDNLRVCPRPGHADYTASVRYQGFQDYRGGGHFSGRLTAPIVFAGALSKLALKHLYPEVKIGSRIVQLGPVEDATIVEDYTSLMYDSPADAPTFPTADSTLPDAMKEAVIDAIRDKDSVGGVIEGFVTGLPAGLGDPIFGAVESRLASLLFAVPAVKGVEFGTGFDITRMRGSKANDPFVFEDGKVRTKTNHNGGINGGITNGMPVLFRCAFKPTASIGQPQESVNLETGEASELLIEGRHDPCIVVRACPVVEAVTAFTILDLLLTSRTGGAR